MFQLCVVSLKSVLKSDHKMMYLVRFPSESMAEGTCQLYVTSVSPRSGNMVIDVGQFVNTGGDKVGAEKSNKNI